jgi:hypothetical protein
MSSRPRPSIVARTAEHGIDHPLIPGVQDDFLERVNTYDPHDSWRGRPRPQCSRKGHLQS